MEDISLVLKQVSAGDSAAGEKLLPLVYDELRKLAAHRLAREAPGQTLQGTALVHEAYLRLAGQSEARKWDGRRHFFAAAAEAMRRILVESARRKRSHKHGGQAQRVEEPVENLHDPHGQDEAELLTIHELVDELAATSPRRAELVKLRFFLGCTMAEASEALGISLSAAEEDWTYSRAWLRRRYLSGNSGNCDD